MKKVFYRKKALLNHELSGNREVIAVRSFPPRHPTVERCCRGSLLICTFIGRGAASAALLSLSNGEPEANCAIGVTRQPGGGGQQAAQENITPPLTTRLCRFTWDIYAARRRYAAGRGDGHTQGQVHPAQQRPLAASHSIRHAPRLPAGCPSVPLLFGKWRVSGRVAACRSRDEHSERV